MAEFIFQSPGVKFAEKDLSFVVRNSGITTLGMVGETPKGPAFEPVLVRDKQNFRTRFGLKTNERLGSNLRYTLPYFAESYLSESDELYVTRVLGLSGYNAGQGWAITISADVDPATTGVTSVDEFTDVVFENYEFSGNTILAAVGATGSFVVSKIKNTSTNEFTIVSVNYIVTDITDPLLGEGTIDYSATTITGDSYAEYENMVVGTIRSRANYEFSLGSEVLTFDATNVIASNDAIDDIYGGFVLTATGPLGVETYEVSLLDTSKDYLPNVIGNRPKGKNTKIYVESIYNSLIKKLASENIAYGVNSQLIPLTTPTFSDYNEQFQTPETPWVVSELRGSTLSRLMKFVSISDGNNANREIKVTFQNIDPISGEFDVLIRDFNDTDDNIVVLESFTRCSMRKSLNNYVGKRIGTMGGEFSLRSNYVMLVLSENHPEDSFPAGFEGYMFRSYDSGQTGSISALTPKIMYKTEYTSTDRVRRTFLGISEKAYSTDTLRGTGINRDFFNYIGAVKSEDSISKTKGFHLDIDATGVYTDGLVNIGEFETGFGSIQTGSDVVSPTAPYFERDTRKFTLVPAGGFDGWDEHRVSRTNTDLYRTGSLLSFSGSDYNAFQQAIRTFANPEEVTINLFATPGLNFSDNLSLINETIEMIETERADSLYVIDAPDVTGNDNVFARDIVELLDTTEIDSNYSATYAPWIEVSDEINGVNVFLPPTGEVLKAIAFTDKVRFPWFAPAGLNRGTTNARRARVNISGTAKDTLYLGRINPMVTFLNEGVAIFGQKTLQQRESALDRVNVRRLLLRIRLLISNIAVRLLFEQNDQVTRDEFISKATPILQEIATERGLEEFQIKMDDSINSPESVDRNELYGEILLKPIKSVEFIGITFTITPTGASFENI
jgi:hypothetical protein